MYSADAASSLVGDCCQRNWSLLFLLQISGSDGYLKGEWIVLCLKGLSSVYNRGARGWSEQSI